MKRFTLPSGRVVSLSETSKSADRARGMFAKAIEAMRAHGVDPWDFELADFHALRAIVTRLGWLEEKPIEILCINCRKPMKIKPCSTLELGPFQDGELDDPELDEYGPSMTLAEAAPIHARKREIEDPDAFLAANYPLRLGAVHACPKCGAKNEVDAPYDRECEPARRREPSKRFPSFEMFDREAQRIAEKMMPEDVVLVVEGGVPVCDDGGVPLMGSYVPPFEGSDSAPSRPPEVTVYYRTFRAMHEDEGPYDWRAELHETIEHELEHHGYHLAGHDPMDEEERHAIDREIVRTIGKRELVRRQTKGLFVDLTDFMKKTWPLWLILLIAALGFSVCGGSSD